jgi:hypothetical protein
MWGSDNFGKPVHSSCITTQSQSKSIYKTGQLNKKGLCMTTCDRLISMSLNHHMVNTNYHEFEYKIIY